MNEPMIQDIIQPGTPRMCGILSFPAILQLGMMGIKVQSVYNDLLENFTYGQ